MFAACGVSRACTFAPGTGEAICTPQAPDKAWSATMQFSGEQSHKELGGGARGGGEGWVASRIIRVLLGINVHREAAKHVCWD